MLLAVLQARSMTLCWKADKHQPLKLRTSARVPISTPATGIRGQALASSGGAREVMHGKGALPDVAFFQLGVWDSMTIPMYDHVSPDAQLELPLCSPRIWPFHSWAMLMDSPKLQMGADQRVLYMG